MSWIAIAVGTVFTGVLGIAVIIGVVRLAVALCRRDWASGRRLAWACLRITLIFAGGIVLLTTHGRSYRVTGFLLLAFAALGIVPDWPVLQRMFSGGTNTREKG